MHLSIPLMMLSHSLKRSPTQGLDYPDLAKILDCYLDLKEVFNKAKMTALPPHRPYDCPIDLLPGSAPPEGHLYSLSSPEMVAMKEYINLALAAGITCPSSSPPGAGFFFMGKKNKSIDYRDLNNITIKNRYPPPFNFLCF